MMYHSVIPILVGDTSKIIKVPEITATEHQFQISTAATTGTVAIWGKTVMAPGYSLLATVDLSAAPTLQKIQHIDGVYESFTFTPSTGTAMTITYSCWSWM